VSLIGLNGWPVGRYAQLAPETGDQSAQLWIWPVAEAVCSGAVEQAATVRAKSAATAARPRVLVIDILFLPLMKFN
jgi:hypothetical protein